MTQATRASRLGAVAAAIGLLGAVAVAAPVAEAKKKGGSVDIAQPVNALIPDATPVMGSGTPIDGVLISTIEVGKRFKGRRIRDVNATFQTTGVSGGSPANDLAIHLAAPNGATTQLFNDPAGFGGTAASIGPLTLDDESSKNLGDDDTASNPFELPSPFVGTAQPSGKRLAVMDNGAVRGTWTLLALDRRANPPDRLSILNSWRLTVIAGRPYRTR